VFPLTATPTGRGLLGMGNSFYSLGLRLRRFLALIALTAYASTLKAEPLRPDDWTQQRHENLLNWLYAVADASRPCSMIGPASMPAGVQVQQQTCSIRRVGGNPVQRERKIMLSIAGNSWKGHDISGIVYEQQYSLQEQLVYHAAMKFTLLGPPGVSAAKLRGWWRERGLDPGHDAKLNRELVEREAGIEWFKQFRTKTTYSTEFYE
jgi:hypothetical protein